MNKAQEATLWFLFDDLDKMVFKEDEDAAKAAKSIKKEPPIKLDHWLKYAEEGDFEHQNIEQIVHL